MVTSKGLRHRRKSSGWHRSALLFLASGLRHEYMIHATHKFSTQHFSTPNASFVTCYLHRSTHTHVPPL
jgi:hypothetical protein